MDNFIFWAKALFTLYSCTLVEDFAVSIIDSEGRIYYFKYSLPVAERNLLPMEMALVVQRLAFGVGISSLLVVYLGGGCIFTGESLEFITTDAFSLDKVG